MGCSSPDSSQGGGTVVYENRAVLVGRIVWGKIVDQEDFEDTQKVEVFDRYLAQQESTVS